ncbi:hypothetical protein AURDEDRAFT_152614 [Auricularia subglabra TFB-10046 SS5]|nr:hypothetical protein AURDEDRAFT_152614 [Auricularia subglabra TFB-10046 SS5]
MSGPLNIPVVSGLAPTDSQPSSLPERRVRFELSVDEEAEHAHSDNPDGALFRQGQRPRARGPPKDNPGKKAVKPVPGQSQRHALKSTTKDRTDTALKGDAEDRKRVPSTRQSAPASHAAADAAPFVLVPPSSLGGWAWASHPTKKDATVRQSQKHATSNSAGQPKRDQQPDHTGAERPHPGAKPERHSADSGVRAPQQGMVSQKNPDGKKPQAAPREGKARQPSLSRAAQTGTREQPAKRDATVHIPHRAPRETSDHELWRIADGPETDDTRRERAARARYEERMRLGGEGKDRLAQLSPRPSAFPGSPPPFTWDLTFGAPADTQIQTKDRSQNELPGGIARSKQAPAQLEPGLGQQAAAHRHSTGNAPRVSNLLTTGRKTDLEVELLPGVSGRGGFAVIRRGNVHLNGKVYAVALKEFHSDMDEDDHEFLTQGNMVEYLASTLKADRHQLAFTGKRPWPHLTDLQVYGVVGSRAIHHRPKGDSGTQELISDLVWEQLGDALGNGASIQVYSKRTITRAQLDDWKRSDLTMASDIWSLGCLVTELLDGRSPSHDPTGGLQDWTFCIAASRAIPAFACQPKSCSNIRGCSTRSGRWARARPAPTNGYDAVVSKVWEWNTARQQEHILAKHHWQERTRQQNIMIVTPLVAGPSFSVELLSPEHAVGFGGSAIMSEDTREVRNLHRPTASLPLTRYSCCPAR